MEVSYNDLTKEEELEEEEELDEEEEEELEEELEEDPLNNQIQKDHDRTNNLITFCFIFLCVFGGISVFITLTPIEYNKNIIISFIQNCCSEFYNETRCKMTFLCQYTFQRWIQKEEITRNLLEECCYWFRPYSQTEEVLYCNPLCLQ